MFAGITRERTCDGEARKAVRGGREEYREIFLWILGFCKAGKTPFQLSLFLGLWAMSAEEFPSPKGRGGSESPDFSRPGAADPGCPNPDAGSLRGSAQGGRRRVSRWNGDAGGGW